MWNGKSYTTKLASENKSTVKRTGAPKPASSADTASRSTYASIMAKNFAYRANAPKPAAGSTAPVRSSEAPSSVNLANYPDRRRPYKVNPLYPDRVIEGRRGERRNVPEDTKGSRFYSDVTKNKDLYTAKKGGKVKKFKKGGPVMESSRKPIDPYRSILGSDKDIIARGNRTPYEPIPKTGPDKPKKPLGRAGKAGFKSGGSVMKKGADGVAKKGKTHTKMPKMAMGGIPGKPAMTGLAMAADRSGRAMPTNAGADARGRAMPGMKKGGCAKKYAKGGSIDGIAKRGKTRAPMKKGR
jgi:hypothetical protein